MPSATLTKADCLWLAALQPPHYSAVEWKAKLLDMIVAGDVYDEGSTSASQPAPAISKFSTELLALIQQGGGNSGMNLDQLKQKTGRAGNIIGRALASLKGQNLINETAGGAYLAVGASNVQGIGTGPTPARRGRRPGTRQAAANAA